MGRKPNAKARGDEQEPDTRCGTLGTSGHVKELMSWIMRRFRCYLWVQLGARGCRELRKRGVTRDLAWNTSKSGHGPWRLSMSPALSFALPTGYFVELGLPLLHQDS